MKIKGVRREGKKTREINIVKGKGKTFAGVYDRKS